MSIPHRLLINGRSLEALIEPKDTLLEVIRYKLDLIGTKQGCDKGDCGACTVLIEGEAKLACLTLALLVSDEAAITTIEGLAGPAGLDIILQSFNRCGALQCGFCQPGMILSAKALLMKNNRPSLREIKEALSGNLCRCTGYTKIYRAVFCASLVLRGEAQNLEQAMALTPQLLTESYDEHL